MPTLDWIGKDAVIRHHKDDRKIGGLWEEMSRGKCLFVMATEKDWAPIKEKI